jgi:sugar/nucleoside kinase (ribokinase family)
VTDYDVLVLGEPLLERHADAAGAPTAPDAVSGDAFNAACAAVLAGARVAMLTALGRDEGGDRVLAELDRRGVDTGFVLRDDRPTGAYTISPDADGRPEFSYQRAGSAASALDRSRLDGWRAVLDSTPVLFTSGIFAALTPDTEALTLAAVRAAAAAGAQVCFDVNFRPRLTTAADALRVLHAAAPDCRLVKIATPGDSVPLLGLERPDEVAAAVAARTPADVVVTDSDRPLTLRVADRISRFPVHPAPTFVDATGAGDVLAGTLAAGLARGESVAGALPAAMAAAALSTGHRGGAPHATRDEVAALLAARGVTS